MAWGRDKLATGWPARRRAGHAEATAEATAPRPANAPAPAAAGLPGHPQPVAVLNSASLSPASSFWAPTIYTLDRYSVPMVSAGAGVGVDGTRCFGVCVW